MADSSPNLGDQSSAGQGPQAAVFSTSAFQQFIANAQIKACDEALSLCGDRDRLRKEILELQAAIRSVESECQQQFLTHTKAARDRSRSAQQAADAETICIAKCRGELEQADQRLKGLLAAALSNQDVARIAAVVAKAQEACNPEIRRLEQERDKAQQRQGEHAKSIAETEQALASSKAALPLFEAGQVPPRFKSIVEQAAQRAEAEHAARLAAAELEQKRISASSDTATGELSREARRHASAIAAVNELARVTSHGLLARLTSSVWWGSLNTDYRQDAIAASEQQRVIAQRIESLSRELQQADEAGRALVAGKAEFVAEAIAAETTSQHQQCREAAARLPGEIERLQAMAAAESATLTRIAEAMDAAIKQWQAAGSSAEESERAAIRKEAEEACAWAQTAFDQALVQGTKLAEVVRDSEAALARLPQEHEAILVSRQAEHRSRLVAIDAELEGIQAAIAKLVAQYGLGVSYPFAHTAIENARETRLKMTTPTVIKGRSTGTRGVQDAKRRPPMTQGPTGELGNTGAPEEAGHLYLDFARNAEDNVDRQGRRFPGLRRQLNELRRKHGDAMFAGVDEDADLLAIFQDAFFPHGLTQTYFVSNLSLRDQPFLALRPKTIGPRLEQFLPRGLSIALCGRLWDPENPVFLPQRLVDLSHSEVRPFEREITAFVLTQPVPVYMRQNNVLPPSFVAELPPISVRTRERLQDWQAYLDWKERLIQANLVGLRYVKVEVTREGRYRFLVVAESKESFERVRRTFRNDEFRAFALGYSLDPWDFQYNEDHRGRDVELGEFEKYEQPEALSEANTEGMPWADPFAAWVYFRMDEEDQNEFDSMMEAGGHEDAATHFRDQFQDAGFLALSAVGDLSLVRRQRRELEQLQQQSGYAPFLSSYLFDIKSANVPAALAEIPDGQWFRKDLNDDQKLAVRKMISTPDLAMVQGPPGTGKTTMIAEATYQFVRQRKKVLIVSQANLAVENALERLAQAPAVRAIRLGKKGEKDQPFSPVRVLDTYYGSVAAACRERSLDAWKQGDDRSKAITKWLQDCDLLAGDIAGLVTDQQKADQVIGDAETQLAAENERAEGTRAQARKKHAAEQFLRFLDQDGPHAEELPDNVLRIFHEVVVLPMESLLAVGIRVNRLWPRFDHGPVAERPSYAAEVLREWRCLLSFLPQLTGDLERLRAADGDLVLSQADALELGELNRRLAAAQQAMVDDAGRVTEWQAIQKQIREVKRRGSGLDRAVYERVFSRRDMTPPPHLTFTDPAASRATVVAALNGAIEAILQVDTQVSKGVSQVRQEVVAYMGALEIGEGINQPLVHQLESRIRETRTRLGEFAAQLEAKQSRLHALMRKCAETDALPGEWTHDKYQQMRQHVVERRDALNQQREQMQAFRQDWEPLLQDWVKDLRRVETLRSDQTNFLPTYTSACNVVGVTCTENRRTLEDAGHTRFDVVIVDEVSKATPPEIVMPLLMGRTAILVGDHRQLPPLFKEREGSWEEVVAEKEETAESAPDEADPASELTAENFERFRTMVTSSLFKEHFENAPEQLKSFLFTQYRMHPQIMRVVNQFYENRLVCGLTDPDAQKAGSDPRGHRVHSMSLAGPRGQPYVKPEQHVIWVDSSTDPGRQRHLERRINNGKVNDLEAMLIAKVLIDIEVACRQQGHGLKGKGLKQVGVITFYGKQVRNIREAVRRVQRLRRIDFTAIKIDVNTVDRYQGQERPIVIVSMVRNPPWKLSARANTAQFERINVAFSRAQELLVVVGAKDVFCTYPVDLPFLERPGRRNIEVYRHIIDEIQRNAGFWKSEQVMSPQEYAQCMPRGESRELRR